MKLYSVSDWNDYYENNRSRLVKDLAWVPVPNGHDGENYSRLITGKNAAEIFAAWILILQVASRCTPRGTLTRSNGSPHDPASLSLKTRAPATWFEKSLPALIECGWLYCNQLTDNDTAHACRSSAESTSQACQRGDEEGKGIEENGKEGKDGRAVALPDDAWLASLAKDPAYQRIAVEVEIAKCRRWSETNRKPFSRKRLVNWLNRVEAPISGGPSTITTNRYQMPAATAADHARDGFE